MKGKLMKAKIAGVMMVTLCAVSVLMAGPDGDKIAGKCKVIGRDRMQGFDRIRFEFEGCMAWVVEPAKPAAGSPWAWCMEWPTAFQNRTGVKELLEAGYRWVTFNPAYGWNKKPLAGNQNDEMVAKRNRFQKFLVQELGLEEKCCLVGMSWGGFYSVRYASIHPECVKAMYLDAPLLDFSSLAGFKDKTHARIKEFYPHITEDYCGANDPLQPVHPSRAATIAKAGIPVLLIYGAVDKVVPAETNCLRFADAFEKAGGHLLLWRDNLRGHHPHGLEPGEGCVFVNFFNNAQKKNNRR
jgi:pimeloyl-ACP methyl ester carboxylesterase